MSEVSTNASVTQAATDALTQAVITPTTQAVEGNNTQLDYKSEYEKATGKLQAAVTAEKSLRARLKELEALEAKVKADAEEKLKQQGDYQKLLEAKEAELSQIKPIVENYTRLSSILVERAKSEVKDWPKEAKDLLPSTDDPFAYVEAVEKIKPLAAKLTPAQAQPGNKPNPPVAQQQGFTVEDAIALAKRSGSYGSF